MPPRKPRQRRLRRTSSIRRLNATLLAVAFAISLIVGRLIQLQGVAGSHYRALSEKHNVVPVPIPAVRGDITSSDGTVLAMTVQTDQVTADPPEIRQSMTGQSVPLAKAARVLARPLRMKRSAILHLLRHPSSREYVQLKAAINVTTAAAISKLGIAGIALSPSYTRAYPGGDLASGMLGFVNTNGSTGVMTGAAGLENAYNSMLSGRDGELDEEIGPDGPVPGTEELVKKAVPASSLRLTIQADIQWEAQRECALQVRATKAKNCSVIVMQARTGKILALAQYPTYQPGGPHLELAPDRGPAAVRDLRARQHREGDHRRRGVRVRRRDAAHQL